MEKGWDRINIHGESPEGKEEIKESLEKSKPLVERKYRKGTLDFYNRKEHEDVVELEKTALEKRLIKETLEAINKQLLSEVGVKNMNIPEERIHIVSPEEYKRRFQLEYPDFAGIFSTGHVYIQRTGDTLDFINRLTHEMIHAASFESLKIRQIPVDKEQSKLAKIFNKTRVINYSDRMGFHFTHVHPKDKKMTSGFVGLNEAFTEWLAHNIRMQLVKSGQLKDIITDKEGEILESRFTYGWQIMVLIKVLAFAKEPNAKGGQLPIWEAVGNYFQGDYSFLQRLEKKKKGATKTLFNMGITHEDAEKAAKELGFEDIAKLIENKEFKWSYLEGAKL